MIVINTAQLLGSINDIEISPHSVIPVQGDVRTAVQYIPPVMEKDALMMRVADLLRRTGVEDAEQLIRELEVRMTPPETEHRVSGPIIEDEMAALSPQFIARMQEWLLNNRR